ncbi:hypothetical protein LPJ56_001840, partial [Coemansia sp. RSA 2599]
MSGFGNKRKKYSWLPETNPAALSGDIGSSASAAKPDAGEAAPRQPKPRPKSGTGPKAKKEKPSSISAERSDIHQVEGLGITTPGADMPAALQTSKATATATAIEPAAEKKDKAAVKPEVGSSGTAAATEASKSVAARPRRRSRKDSLDEL